MGLGDLGDGAVLVGRAPVRLSSGHDHAQPAHPTWRGGLVTAESSAVATDESATAHPGLLTELMTNTLDEDYRVAAEKAKDRPASTRGSGGPIAVVVILLFGAMIG